MRPQLNDCNQDELRILVRGLAGKVGKAAVNLGSVFYAFTANSLTRVMMGRRVFSENSSAGDDPEAEEFKAMVVELMELAGVFNYGDYIPGLDWLDLQGVVGKMKRLHTRFDSFLNKVVEEHKRDIARDRKQLDLLSELISLKDNADGEGGKLNDIEIKALLLVNYYSYITFILFVPSFIYLFHA